MSRHLSHEARAVAESFGFDAERYGRTRPSCPLALIGQVLAAGAGPDVLDVGTGTGIVAWLFEGMGAQVFGIDVDPRMAEYARRQGLDVGVAKFEDWQAGSRLFDAVVAGQTAKLDGLMAGLGQAIDAVGGSFTMNYTTVAVTAARSGA